MKYWTPAVLLFAMLTCNPLQAAEESQSSKSSVLLGGNYSSMQNPPPLPKGSSNYYCPNKEPLMRKLEDLLAILSDVNGFEAKGIKDVTIWLGVQLSLEGRVVDVSMESNSNEEATSILFPVMRKEILSYGLICEAQGRKRIVFPLGFQLLN